MYLFIIIYYLLLFIYLAAVLGVEPRSTELSPPLPSHLFLYEMRFKIITCLAGLLYFITLKLLISFIRVLSKQLPFCFCGEGRVRFRA